MKKCILLTTHNRNPFAKRFLEFYKAQKYTGEIVIAHSGTEESQREIREMVAHYSMLRLKLFNYPESQNFFTKILETLNKIQHEYIAICADDDYILPNTFLEAADFLSANPEYVSASGYMFVIGTSLSEGQYCYPYRQLPLNQTKKFKRLFYHLNFYTATFYNTYRRKDLLYIYEQADRLYIEKKFNGRYMELFMSGLVALMGKTHILDSLYMIRQGDNPVAASASLSPESLIIADSQIFKDFHRDFVKYLGNLSNRRFYQCSKISSALLSFAASLIEFRPFLKKLLTQRKFNYLLLKIVIFSFLRRDQVQPIFYETDKLAAFQNMSELLAISQLINTYPVGIIPNR